MVRIKVCITEWGGDDEPSFYWRAEADGCGKGQMAASTVGKGRMP